MPPVRSRTVLEKLDKLKAKAKKKVRGKHHASHTDDLPSASITGPNDNNIHSNNSNSAALNASPPDLYHDPPSLSVRNSSDSPVSVHQSPHINTTTEPDGLWESLYLPTGALSTRVSVGAATTAGVELMADASASGAPVRTRKFNQDCFGVTPHFSGARDALFAAVYDGHGAQGGEASRLTRDVVPAVMTDALAAHMARCGGTLRDNLPPEERRRAYFRVFTKAFVEAERALKEELHGIHHEYSGTTATCLWLDGSDLFVAWAGDSRAILGKKDDDDTEVAAIDLTWDQKPARPDEKKRVRNAGARVTRWKKGVGPQRVWLPDEWVPGLAMTRSVGDTILTRFGVVPSPEVTVTQLTEEACFVVVASDGVWEFMSSNEVARLVQRLRDEGACAETAARELVNEAVRRWTENESVVDDTTAVVLFVDFEEGKAVRRTSALGRLMERGEYENRSIKDLFRKGREGVADLRVGGTPCLVGANGRLELFVPYHDTGSDDEGAAETD